MRVLGVFFIVLGLALIGAGALAYQWYRQPLALPTTPLEFEVRAGSTLSAVARDLRDAGVVAHPLALTALARFKRVDRTIKAGSYEIAQGITLPELLAKLTQGDVTQSSFSTSTRPSGRRRSSRRRSRRTSR